MWSTTTRGGQRREERLHLRRGPASRNRSTTCQPSLAIALGDALEHVARREIHQPLEEIEAHAAHAGVVHPFQLVVGDLLADERDALAPCRWTLRARPPVARLSLSNGRSPARSRSCRSRENRAARTAFPSAHRTACTCAPARRETRLRPEHVAMRIDRARRRLVFRLRRIGMERNVAGTHRHGSVLLRIMRVRNRKRWRTTRSIILIAC